MKRYDNEGIMLHVLLDRDERLDLANEHNADRIREEEWDRIQRLERSDKIESIIIEGYSQELIDELLNILLKARFVTAVDRAINEIIYEYGI